MSQNLSRKHFFAKLAGVFAAIGFVPKLLAKPQVVQSAESAPKPSIKLRPEARAVSRRESTV